MFCFIFFCFISFLFKLIFFFFSSIWFILFFFFFYSFLLYIILLLSTININDMINVFSINIDWKYFLHLYQFKKSVILIDWAIVIEINKIKTFLNCFARRNSSWTINTNNYVIIVLFNDMNCALPGVYYLICIVLKNSNDWINTHNHVINVLINHINLALNILTIFISFNSNTFIMVPSYCIIHTFFSIPAVILFYPSSDSFYFSRWMLWLQW